MRTHSIGGGIEFIHKTLIPSIHGIPQHLANNLKQPVLPSSVSREVKIEKILERLRGLGVDQCGPTFLVCRAGGGGIDGADERDDEGLDGIEELQHDVTCVEMARDLGKLTSETSSAADAGGAWPFPLGDMTMVKQRDESSTFVVSGGGHRRDDVRFHRFDFRYASFARAMKNRQYTRARACRRFI